MRKPQRYSIRRSGLRVLKITQAIFFASFFLLSACGQKGPLFLASDELSAGESTEQGVEQSTEDKKEEPTE